MFNKNVCNIHIQLGYFLSIAYIDFLSIAYIDEYLAVFG